MISFVAAAALLILVVYIFLRQRIVAVAAFFLLFPFAYRVIDIAYLDMFGPAYASELGRYVGGGTATPAFVYGVLAVLLPILYVFRAGAPVFTRLRWVQPWQSYHRLIANIGLGAIASLALILFANMLRVGPIPLFAGIDRIDYNLMAGPVHRNAYELNFIVFYSLGALTILPRINSKDFDIRPVVLAVILLVYWVLTGNRFSIFFSAISFFSMPLATVLVMRRAGMVRDLGQASIVTRLLSAKAPRAIASIIVLGCVIGLVFNSYYNVRSYRDPLQEIQERIFVQPVELWAAQWDRVDFSKLHLSVNRLAFDQIFLNPIDPTRNTTVQYLMTEELGYFRSMELAQLGQQYNGGYPEVHFSLFSSWIALFTLPLCGMLTALLLRYVIVLLCRNMIASSIMAMYVYFGFLLHYVGGYITFFLSPSYWVKIVLLLIALLWESRFASSSGRHSPRLTVWATDASTAHR